MSRAGRSHKHPHPAAKGPKIGHKQHNEMIVAQDTVTQEINDVKLVFFGRNCHVETVDLFCALRAGATWKQKESALPFTKSTIGEILDCGEYNVLGCRLPEP